MLLVYPMDLVKLICSLNSKLLTGRNLVARYCLKLIYHNQKMILRLPAQMSQYWDC